MKRQTVRVVIASVMMVAFLGLVSCASAPKTEVQKDEAQASIREMAAKTLTSFSWPTPRRMS